MARTNPIAESNAKSLTIDQLPRLTDEQREALDQGGIAMQGVPVGDEPADHEGSDAALVKMIPIPAEVADGMCARLCGLEALIRCVQLSLENDGEASSAADALHTVADLLISRLMIDVDVSIWSEQLAVLP